MKAKSSLIFLTVLLFGNATVREVRANSLPNIEAKKISEKQVGIKMPDSIWNPELSPSVIRQNNGKRLYVLSGASSYLCDSTQNILETTPGNPLQTSSSNCQLVTKQEILDHIAGSDSFFKDSDNVSTPGWQSRLQDWNRTYDGIVSIGLINTGNENRLVTLRYGENVNARVFDANLITGEKRFQNPMYNVPVNGYYHSPNPSCDSNPGWNKCEWPDGCYSGYKDNAYTHCGDSYANFINLSWSSYSPQTGWQKDVDRWVDEGPILWPSKPYKKSDGTSGGGGITSSLFVDKNYLYTFSRDWLCLGVARSDIGSGGVAGSWTYYKNGRFNSPALPNGFDKTNIQSFYTTTGVQPDCLDTNTPAEPGVGFNFFNVAKIRNTSYYIASMEISYLADQGGMSNGHPDGHWEMAVKFSPDLIHWSPAQVLAFADGDPGKKNGDWGKGWYAYPTFYDKNATTNYEIDPEEFYIYGVHATNSTGYEHMVMKLSLTLKPPTDKIDPLIRQYFQQFLKKDNPDPSSWHRDIMNNLGCKGVIRDFTLGPEFTQGYKRTTTNEEYITLLYRAILSRDPDSSGMSWYLNRLNNGVSRDAVADEIMSGQEANDVCIAGNLISPPTPKSCNSICSNNNECQSGYCKIPGGLVPNGSCRNPSCSDQADCVCPSPTPIPGDITGLTGSPDGVVNIYDYNLLIGDFGKSNSPADINGNGLVDIYDYNTLVGNFGKNQ